MACAQCHDHKYDPITQRDHYSLMAAFNHVPETAGKSFDQVLLDEKERLNATDVAGEIPQNQVLIFEIVRQRVFDDFIETMIFAAIAESVAPVFALLEFAS